MMTGLRKMRRRERGQGMTEYIIVVAVIAVLSIAVVTLFGNRLRGIFFNTGSEMIGEKDNKKDLTGEDADEYVEKDLSGVMN